MRLGAHVSSGGKLTGALLKGELMGAEVIQMFTSNPKGWAFKVRDEEEFKEFKERLESGQVKEIFGHSIYLSNLASQNNYIYTNTINNLVSGMVMAGKAGFAGVVTHIGAHGGVGEKEGILRVVNAIKQIQGITEGKVPLLLETDSGAGTHLGGRFEEISEIIKTAEVDSIGVCLDTCHIFVAGYDILTPPKFDEVLNDFDKKIGLKNLKLLHLNDSKGELGSHLDRHEEIGKGKIGEEIFRYIVNHPKLKDIPGVVETPDNKGEEAERTSLNLLKEMRE
jgi:deoxyribonuclease-4